MDNNQQNEIVVQTSQKSMLLAIVLTLLLGPLGILYSSILWGILMLIFTPIIVIIVSIMTLGVGLPFIGGLMWLINLIISIVCVSSHNDKSRRVGASEKISIQQDMSQEKTLVQTPAPICSYFKYDEANKLSISEIKELISSSKDDLNPQYLETLKFILGERIEQKNIEEKRVLSYEKALALTTEEKNTRLASPSLYNEDQIKAIEYIRRCEECGLKPNSEGFLSTYRIGYVAPETPKEKIRRLNIKAEEERKAKKEEMTTTAFLATFIALIVLGIVMYKINKMQDIYSSSLQQAAQQFEEKNYDMTMSLYRRALIDMPFWKGEEDVKFIESKIEEVKKLKKR